MRATPPGLAPGILSLLLAAALAWPHTVEAGPVAAGVADGAGAPVRRPSLSPDAQRVVKWIREANDNQNMSFAVIDKREASVHVFDPAGGWLASSPVLLGLARGDDSVPGIGDRKMSEIRPEERTTPAGRFRVEPGRNLQGEDIVWIDYEAAISMHRVRANNAAERRLERLATASVKDNRISYGCVNVPAAFYDAYLMPTLGTTRGVVYVLPEVRSASDTFGMNGRRNTLRRQVSD